MFVENTDYIKLENYIKAESPDVIGVYSNSYYWWDTVHTVKIVKNISKDIIVVLGGPHVFIYPKETISFPEVDYVIYGEGELAFKELLDNLENKKSVEDIPGVITKLNQNKPFEFQRMEDLDKLPFPDRNLVSYKKYNSILAIKNPITTLMSSRGCPYNCYFCSSEKMHKPRGRSPDNVVEELTICVKMGINDFLFFDELFTFPKKRAIQICEKIVDSGLKIRWQIRSRADVIDRELAKKLKKAGCQLIQFGIETGSPHIQKVLNKNLNLNKVKETIKIVKEEGILTYGDFMLGSPEETKDEIFQTIKFAKELHLDYAVFYITQILPETELYNRALRENILDRDYWQEYALNPENQLKNINWLVNFSVEEINNLARLAYRIFYFNLRYIWGSIKRIKTLKQLFWQVKVGIKTFLFS